jgi:hypothetical protein
MRIAAIGLSAALLIADGKPGAAQADANELAELRRLLTEQQARMAEQQRLLEELQAKIEALEAAAPSPEPPVAFEEVPSEPAPAQPPYPAEPPYPEEAPRRVVTSGEPLIELELSGHINRMVNVASDGDSTKAYFVDNSNSPSRVRFVGSARVDQDLALGTAIELGIAPNSSFFVSQDNEDDGDFFDQRVVQVYLDSSRFGRLTLGKGSMASDGAGLQDLSGTAVIHYSSVGDTAGGLKFRTDDGDLTGVRVRDGFNNLDGPRRDRVRYDTPLFGGFRLAGSLATDQRYDGALYWTGRNEQIAATLALGAQDQNLDNVDALLVSSGSIHHLASGLNATYSIGRELRDGRDYTTLYGKLGWIADLLPIGATAFSIDYLKNDDRFIGSDDARFSDGQSAGVAAVQNWARFGAEFYAGLRWYQLELLGGPDVDDIVVGSTGTRVRF